MDDMRELLHHVIADGLDGDLQALLMAQTLISYLAQQQRIEHAQSAELMTLGGQYVQHAV